MTRTYDDACAIAIPQEQFPTDLNAMVGFIGKLSATAEEAIHERYPHVTLHAAEWAFCTTPEEVDAWELPHDCEDCRQCKVLGIQLLAEDPTQIIALGHLYCSEHEA